LAPLRLNRRVYILGTAGLVRSIGRSATFVFLPLVFANVYHLPYLVIGGLIAAIVPVSTLSYLAGGHVSDRFGRRPFAVYPTFLTAASMAFLWAFLDRGVPVVMALWGLNALFNGLSRPAQSAMIGDVTSPELAVTAFGVQRVFTNTGFAISPAVGGVLATTTGLPTLFLFASITSVLEGILLVLLLRETFVGGPAAGARAWRSITVPFRDRVFVSVLVGLAGLSLVMNQFGTPLALYLGSVRGVSYTDFGLVYSLNGLLVVLLQLPLGRLVERWQQYLGSMALGTLAYGFAFVLFDFARSLPQYLLSMGILTLGEDVVSPTQQSLVARFTGPERRASYFGAYNAATNGTRVVSPVVGTLLLGLGTSGPEFLWFGMAAVSAVVAGVFVSLLREARTRVERAEIRGGSPPPVDAMLAGPTRVPHGSREVVRSLPDGHDDRRSR
jgi:MFS family permease